MGNCIFGNRGPDTRNNGFKSIHEIILRNGPFKTEPLSMKELEPYGTIESFEEKVLAMERIVYSVNEDVLFSQTEYIFALFHICHLMMSEYYFHFDCDLTTSVGCPMQDKNVYVMGFAELQSFHLSIGNYNTNPSGIDINEWCSAVSLQRTVLEELKKLPKFAK